MRRRAEPRGRRGAFFYVGLVLVLVGVSLLGYVGWQMYGTNYVSRQTQERIVGELHQQWRTDLGSAGRSEGGGQGRSPSHVPDGKASALIRIPAFGKDYVVPVLEGTSDEVLASGYGHFSDSADPGRKGNYALAAHRVTHGEPLRHMPDLRPGDKVIVETRDATYTYRLDTNPNDLIVTFRDTWVISSAPHNPDSQGVEPVRGKGNRNRLITLTTCSELFHTDNRMIAFGHLVRRHART